MRSYPGLHVNYGELLGGWSEVLQFSIRFLQRVRFASGAPCADGEGDAPPTVSVIFEDTDTEVGVCVCVCVVSVVFAGCGCVCM